MTKFYFSSIFIILTFICNAQTIKQIGEINPGSASSYYADYGTVLSKDGILYFAADADATGVELYKFDGTATTLIKDINPGTGDSNPSSMFVLNGKLIFVANNGTNGVEWWTTDGTDAGTVLIKDISVGATDGVFVPSSLREQNYLKDGNTLYFCGNSGNSNSSNYELWKTDGTTVGTVLVKNIAPDSPFATSSFPDYFVKFKGEVYFSCRQGLWKTNGTEAGTVLVKSSIDPGDLINFNDQKLYFVNENSSSAPDLWVSDGTAAGTVLVKAMKSISRNWSGNRFSIVGNQVLFPGDDGAGAGDELWKTDGTAVGTTIVRDLWAGTNGEAPQNTVVLNNKLYYKGDNGTTGYELYESDGTSAGTKLVLEINPGTRGCFTLPTEIITNGKRIYMNAGKDFQKQLWISDGTAAGTKEIVINPNDESDPGGLYKFGNKLFVFATNNASGYEPYVITFTDEVVDEDNDGFNSTLDCNDNDPTINPNAPEICDGKDNNCKNGIDEGLPLITYYEDKDGDGFGNAAMTKSTCLTTAPTGFVSVSTDCDDTNAAINPNSAEICDNIDNNCSGVADEGLAVNTYYEDKDGDGFGNPSISKSTCQTTAPTGFVSTKTDCNDNDAAINPSKAEICDDKDNNCSGAIDEGLPQNTYYEDKDGDGFGSTVVFSSCKSAAPNGYATNNKDCNDNNAAVNPNGVDNSANGIDEDCSGGDFIVSTFQDLSSGISINPNPASDQIFIDIKYQGDVNIELMSLTGQTILTDRNTTILNVDHVNNGVYILKFTNTSHSKALYRMVVIQH